MTQNEPATTWYTGIEFAAYDRVALPIPVPTPAVDHTRTPLNAGASRQSTAVSPVRPPPTAAPQVPSPLSPRRFPGANPGTNRLVRQLPPPVPREVGSRPPRDLIGRPTLPQPLLNVSADFRPLQLADPRPTTPSSIGLFLGSHRPIPIATAVTLQLPAHSALRSAELPGDLHLTPTGTSRLGYNLTLLKRKMMGHRGDSFRKGFLITHPFERPRGVFA